MRTFLISLAAAASTVALAAPAAAQWYPQPQPQPYGYGYQYPQPQPQYGYGYQQPYQNPYQQPYGYGYQNQYQQQPYGYSYGYRSPYQQPYGHVHSYASYGQLRATKVRIDRIQYDLRRLAQYRMISRNEYSNRIADSREIERRFYRNTRDGYGLSVHELYDVQRRVAYLEQKIARDIRDGRQWGFRW